MSEVAFSQTVKLYKQYKFPSLQKASQTEYSIVFDHWISILGNKDFSEIKISMLSRLKDYAVSREKTSEINKYFYRHLQILKSLIVFAEDNEILVGVTEHEIRKYMQKLRNDSGLLINSKYGGDIVEPKDLDKLLRFWKVHNEMDTAMKIRNRVVIALMYDTGLKTSELVAAKIKDYNPNTRTMIIGKRKGKKVKRSHVLPKTTCSLINSYLRYRRGFAKQDGIYTDNAQELVVTYTSSDQDKMHTHPITPRSVQRLIKQTANESGIDKIITPKTLRASAIVNAILDDSISLDDLNRMFGFKGVTGYQQYIPLAKEIAGLTADYVSIPTFALKYSVPDHYIYDLCVRNKIPSKRFRKYYYISRKEIAPNALKKISEHSL